MEYLVTAIQLSDGNYYCADPETKRTDIITTGDAAQGGLSPTGYFLYEAPPLTAPDPIPEDDQAESTRVYEGSIEFGLACGVTSVTINIEGRVETLNDGFDEILITLNGVQVYHEASTQIIYGVGNGTYKYNDDEWGRPYETELRSEFDVVIPITEHRPCGNIIKVFASTIDEIANNDVWWYANVTSIT